MTASNIVETTFRHDFFGDIPREVGEFWTARQRQMHSLHYAISYRASYKPELPRFFIEKYSRTGETVLDPFGGRGTTALQAVLMNRKAVNADVNPLSERIVRPKLQPPEFEEIKSRLEQIDFSKKINSTIDLSMFYHPSTERQLLSLKEHLRTNREPVDLFIELIALSRLHGHSPGFFSVYSFPQISVPPEAQNRINRKRNQSPEERNVPQLILRKAKRVLKDGSLAQIRTVGAESETHISDARDLNEIPENSIDFIVTSPPFLNKADYVLDNWLEFWFCGIDSKPLAQKIIMTSNIDKWKIFIRESMMEMYRILRPGRHAAIEVGEVMDDETLIFLDEVLVDLAKELHQDGCSLSPERIYIHQQDFTKLANCFNVDNNRKGTNTNRIVVFRKDA